MDRETRDQLFSTLGRMEAKMESIVEGQKRESQSVKDRFAAEVEPLAADVRSMKRAGNMLLGALAALAMGFKEVKTAILKIVLAGGY